MMTKSNFSIHSLGRFPPLVQKYSMLFGPHVEISFLACSIERSSMSMPKIFEFG